MHQISNGLIEDIAAEIGFTAATALVAWFGGGNLYIPMQALPEHPIAKIIGLSAFRRLVLMYDKAEWQIHERTIWIDNHHPLAVQRTERNRLVLELLDMGKREIEVAEMTSLGVRRVQQIRIEAEETGVVELLRAERDRLRQIEVAKKLDMQRNPHGKTRGKS
jgi:hypothetical protein